MCWRYTLVVSFHVGSFTMLCCNGLSCVSSIAVVFGQRPTRANGCRHGRTAAATMIMPPKRPSNGGNAQLDGFGRGLPLERVLIDLKWALFRCLACILVCM